jgi:RNA polymerase sigma factor (TIGR02999 family)
MARGMLAFSGAYLADQPINPLPCAASRLVSAGLYLSLAMGKPGNSRMMPTDKETEVTLLLHSAQAGDPEALDEALRQMYAALHRLARAQLRQNSSERTLSATALVNEAYLKVFGGNGAPEWESRGHLLGVAARAMREVLIDAARRRQAAKRPQNIDRVELSDISSSLSPEVDYAALIECMETLERIDPRQANIVSMRFFVGLNAEQIAAAMNISPATVQREWRLARAWLQRELQG